MESHQNAIGKKAFSKEQSGYHQPQPTWTQLTCWHSKAFRDLIHNNPAENHLFGQTLAKEMSMSLSKRPIIDFNLLEMAQFSVIYSFAFETFFEMFSFICTPVHSGLVHTLLPCNLLHS